MSHGHTHDPPAERRHGPYETSYDVRRGYDVPPPATRRADPRAPSMVAARREDRGDARSYG